MGKFYGTIGYIETVETKPGIWTEQVTERKYSGDITRNYAKKEPAEGVNDDLNISNEISIVSDPYALEHFFAMRYVKFEWPPLGGTWKINNAEVLLPRIQLSIGGVYNGDKRATSD